MRHFPLFFFLRLFFVVYIFEQKGRYRRRQGRNRLGVRVEDAVRERVKSECSEREREREREREKEGGKGAEREREV
jgi:hypothetical protein